MSGRGWAYTGAILGGAVSVAANVAHSYVPPAAAPASWRPNGGSVVGAVFWPVALFVAIEILARVVWPDGRLWVSVRYLGLLPVAVVAAVVSYRHLSGLLSWYGEDSLTATVGPLAVDGLMVMATGALIATGRLRRAPETAPGPVAVDPAPEQPEQPLSVTASDRTDKPTRRRRDSAQAKVAKAHTRWPELSHTELAKKVGVSARTVSRHRPPLEGASA